MSVLLPLAGYGAYSAGKSLGFWSGGKARKPRGLVSGRGWAGRYPENAGIPPYRSGANDPMYHESGVRGVPLRSGRKKKKAGLPTPSLSDVVGFVSPAIGATMRVGQTIFGSGGGAKRRPRRPRRPKQRKRKSKK